MRELRGKSCARIITMGLLLKTVEKTSKRALITSVSSAMGATKETSINERKQKGEGREEEGERSTLGNLLENPDGHGI